MNSVPFMLLRISPVKEWWHQVAHIMPITGMVIGPALAIRWIVLAYMPRTEAAYLAATDVSGFVALGGVIATIVIAVTGAYKAQTDRMTMLAKSREFEILHSPIRRPPMPSSEVVEANGVDPDNAKQKRVRDRKDKDGLK